MVAARLEACSNKHMLFITPGLIGNTLDASLHTHIGTVCKSGNLPQRMVLPYFSETPTTNSSRRLSPLHFVEPKSTADTTTQRECSA
jgi:hypothetical protein